MYSESRSSVILMLVTSWFSRKKKARTGRYLLKKRHGNAYFIILGFTAEQQRCCIYGKVLQKPLKLATFVVWKH